MFRYLFIIAAVVISPCTSSLAGPLEDAQVEVLYDQALDAFQNGRAQFAADLLEQALVLAPEDTQAALLNGTVLCTLGNYEKARGFLKQVLKKEPNHVDAGINLGIANFELGYWKDAKKAFGKVAEHQPQNALAHLNLGILALRAQEWEEAKVFFEKTIKLSPKDFKAWVGLGDALTWLNLNKEAVDARKKALELQPQDQDVRLKLAGSLYALGELSQVASVLKGLEKANVPEVHFLLGILQHREGNLLRSEESFGRALALRPDYPQAAVNLGITLYDQGRYVEAIAKFNEVLKLHPKNTEAQENLLIAQSVAVGYLTKKGSQAYVQGSYQDALELWGRVLEIDSKNKVVRGLVKTAQERLGQQAQILAGQAQALEEAGNYSGAVKLWGEALDMDPHNKASLQGLEKVGSKIDGIVEIYQQQIAAALLDDSFDKARRQSAEVTRINAKAGQKLTQKIDAAVSLRIEGLSKKAKKAAADSQWRNAIAYLEEAQDIDSEKQEVRRMLNRLRVRLRSEIADLLKGAEAAGPEAAQAAYAQVLKMDPENSFAKQRVNQPSDSRINAEKGNKVYLQGVYAYAAGDTRKALGLWQEALVLDPEHKQAHQAMEEANRKLKAIAELDAGSKE